MKYFWADPHFFHKAIIGYCERPFRDIDDMTRKLVRNHNDIVTNDDEVFCLGDFAFVNKSNIQRIEPVMKKLKGKKHHLILGNHDDAPPFSYINMGFASVHTSLVVEEFLLIHDPAMAVAAKEFEKVLCGHVHDLTKFMSNNILNVGVDIWDYKPISIDEARSEFA